MLIAGPLASEQTLKDPGIRNGLLEHLVKEQKKVQSQKEGIKRAVRASQALIDEAGGDLRHTQAVRTAKLAVREGNLALEALRKKTLRLSTLVSNATTFDFSNIAIGAFVLLHSEGDVRIKRADGTWETQKVAILRPGDKIVTGKDGRATFYFEKGTKRVSLGGFSAITVVEEREDRYVVALQTKTGAFFETVGKIVKGRQFQIRTPWWQSTIRGTKFLARKDQIIVIEGRVDVSNLRGDKMVSVYEGHSVDISKDGIISKPKKFDIRDIDLSDIQIKG